MLVSCHTCMIFITVWWIWESTANDNKNDRLNVIDHEAAAHKTLSRPHHGLQQLMFALTFIIKKKQIMEKYDDMTDAMPTYTKKY